jgi:hypothetical protein
LIFGQRFERGVSWIWNKNHSAETSGNNQKSVKDWSVHKKIRDSKVGHFCIQYNSDLRQFSVTKRQSILLGYWPQQTICALDAVCITSKIWRRFSVLTAKALYKLFLFRPNCQASCALHKSNFDFAVQSF